MDLVCRLCLPASRRYPHIRTDTTNFVSKQTNDELIMISYLIFLFNFVESVSTLGMKLFKYLFCRGKFGRYFGYFMIFAMWGIHVGLNVDYALD